MKLNKIPIIIDCDPGHDDAIALLLAFASDNLNVLGVSVTGGNQTLEKTLQNAKNIISYANINTRIAQGSDVPLTRELEVAPSVHGDSGLDGPDIPHSNIKTDQLRSADMIRELIMNSKDKVTIVATGPLTNIAIFINRYPELLSKVEQISLMGGSIVGGNWTSAAEFNILVDPEAAKIVFESGIPIIMSGLDVTHKALIYESEVEILRNTNEKIPVFVAELLDFFFKFHKEQGFAGSPVHDACAIAYLVAPELFTTKDMYVEVEVAGEYCIGATVGDQFNIFKRTPNTKVCLDVDREKFFKLIFDKMKIYKERGVL